jgi:hypothetical protein
LTRPVRLAAALAALALVTLACGRSNTSSSGPSMGAVYAGRVVLNDLDPIVRDSSSWWEGPPTFNVRPLNSSTRLDEDRFGVTVRFAHVGSRESLEVGYEVWVSTSIATSFMSAYQNALGNSLSGPKAGDQSLYYNRNIGAGAAPYLNAAYLRVGQTVISIIWSHVDAVAGTSTVGKLAVKAATRLKDVLNGKVRPSPPATQDPVLLPPEGPDLTLLGKTVLPIEVVPQLLVYPAPQEMVTFFKQGGVKDFVFGDYAVDVDTHMEINTAGFKFSSPTGAKDWIDTVYGSSNNLASGVYLNYEQDTGQYVAAFGSGNKGVLMVCKSSALGEQASRSCEGPLVRILKAWGQVLEG